MKARLNHIRPKLAPVAKLLAAITLMFSLGSQAWAQDKLCIPNHEGLPWEGFLPPTIDGYVERIEGIPDVGGDPRVEQGWVRSGLVSYGYGSSSAWMEARVIKDANQPLIYLSFVVQFDPAFDNDDAVVVVFDNGWTSGTTQFSSNARRLIIRPVNGGAGAPGTVGTGPFLIRQDRQPVQVEWSKFSGSQWVDMVGAPTGSDIKVRSWEAGASDKDWSIELKLPTNAVGDWAALGSTFGFYYNVIRVCDGSLACAGNSSQTNDFFTTQFTWPRTTSATEGTAGFRYITGTAASLKDLASLKVQASWLGQAAFASATSTCKGVRFNGMGVLATNGSLGNTLNGASPTTINTLVARLTNDGAAADGQGIRAEFRIANWGVGARSSGPAYAGNWDKIPARPTANLPGGPLNAAKPNSNQTARVDVPAGGPSDIWMQTQIFPGDNYCDPNVQTCLPGARDAHSCIWVLLESNQNATISESSVKDNFDITTMSTRRQSAEISGIGWDAPMVNGGPQQFRLFTTRRFLFSPGPSDDRQGTKMPEGISPKLLVRPNERELNYQLNPPLELELLNTAGLGKAPLWNFVWMVHAIRATPLLMTIGQKTYRVYEPAGSFGQVGQHFGTVERFVDELTAGSELTTGSEIERLGTSGTYSVTVPNNKTMRVQTLTAALAPGEPDPTSHPSRLPWWLLLLVVIVALIVTLYRRFRHA